MLNFTNVKICKFVFFLCNFFSIFFARLLPQSKVNVYNNILLYLISCIKWRSGVLSLKSRRTFRFLSQIHVNLSLCKPVLSRSANLADHYARRHCASQRGVFANETPNVTLAFRVPIGQGTTISVLYNSFIIPLMRRFSLSIHSVKAYLAYGEECEILKSRGNKFRCSK